MAPIKTAAPPAIGKLQGVRAIRRYRNRNGGCRKTSSGPVIFYLALCNIARRVLFPGGFFFDEFTFA
jgi:hypothetical protein